VSSLLNCFKKISTVNIPGQGGQEYLSDVYRNKLRPIWCLVVCELDFAFEQTLALRAAKRVSAFTQRQSLAPRCWNRSSHSGR